ncbi:isochorismatase [Veronia nyctiphanis]|uniref:Isochorismatase n=1 Tax=Veronia nyctiphanis TaxID=1278244 RepID=A0A4Q0YQY6_9GAMM|nr:isochorismatase [Veronia nyctiphanis]
MSDADKKRVTEAVLKASEGWKSAFNRGDAAGAANQYEEGAVMTAMPFGIFIGKVSIQAFWTNIIGQGFDDVKYMGTKLEVVSGDAAIVSASWEMNNAYGIITKELWVLQKDGSAKLRVDDFEIVGAK